MVEVGQEEVLPLCPECDPKSHRAVKNAIQQAKMMSNKPKRQNLDAGSVESLDAGFAALKADGVNLEDNADGLGTEVDYEPVKSEAAPKIKIPTASSNKGKRTTRKGKK